MSSPPGGNSRQLYRFGVYEADLRAGELRKNGTRLRLQEQPFQVLAMLLERSGEVVTREELRLRLWAADTFVDFDHGLNTAINKLRGALDDRADNPRFIETLARRGYRFIAPVQETDDGAGKEPPVPSRNVSATSADPSLRTADQPLASPRGDEARDLPPLHRGVGRGLFALIQVMYLIFYIVCLAKLGRAGEIAGRAFPGYGRVLLVIILLSAVLGIPVRLYLISAVAFDYRGLGSKFPRLFPFVMPLDYLWALAPFLLVDRIGFGLAFAATAALLYVPFAQRTLVRMTYT